MQQLVTKHIRAFKIPRLTHEAIKDKDENTGNIVACDVSGDVGSSKNSGGASSSPALVPVSVGMHEIDDQPLKKKAKNPKDENSKKLLGMFGVTPKLVSQF